jgi:hypothetical protein
LQEEPSIEEAFTTYLGQEFLDPAIAAVHPLIGIDLVVNAWGKEMQETPQMYLSRQESLQDFGLLSWRGKQAEEVVAWLRNVVRERFKPVEDLTIEDVLDQMLHSGSETDRAKVVELVQNFIDKATPFWNVNKPPDKKIEEFFIFGIPDRPGGLDNSVFKRLIDSGQIELHAAAGSGYAVMWEKHRLRALKIKVPVPLHAIERMNTYKAFYLKVEDDQHARVTHHVHKDWMGVKGLPDVFPDKSA